MPFAALPPAASAAQPAARGRRRAGPFTLALIGLAVQGAAWAQSATPSSPAAAPAVPTCCAAPAATPWPGVIGLTVDATDLDHRVLQVTETLAVTPGHLTLLYPRWLPGNHGPNGNVSQLAGLQVMASGQGGGATRSLPWQRDVVEPTAFHLDVPEGVTQLTLSFQHLSPLRRQDGRISMSPTLLGVQWNTVVLYPAGHDSDFIRLQPRLRLPPGWQPATALRGPAGALAQPDAQGWVDFGAVSLTTLVDSPLFAGPHAKRIELDPPGTERPVALNLVADDAALLDASPAQIEAHRKLVQQADKLYGSRHWRHYDFLLSQSSEFGGIGLEHHESSENGVRPGYFKDWDRSARGRDLLPHEFTHSWNGKYRRPADLWTPNFNVPMRDSLLWVYEGQTQFWGHVLAARSGLVNTEQARDSLARTAADNQQRSGRDWRPLQDTTNEAVISVGRGEKPWRDWQRGSDYYDEGLLIWLDADMLIREKSGDKRSLDDFARSFFGVAHANAQDGSVRPRTYTFDDVVKALNAVQPNDWAAFLRERLDRTGPDAAPLDGLGRSGWRLVYTEKESEFARADNSRGEPGQNLDYSLGLRLAKDGMVSTVRWDSPAFQAGLAPGQQVVAVQMNAYQPERLASAITANKGGQHPIELLVKNGEQYRLVKIDYRSGLRYPHLERIPGTPDRLSAQQTAR